MATPKTKQKRNANKKATDTVVEKAKTAVNLTVDTSTPEAASVAVVPEVAPSVVATVEAPSTEANKLDYDNMLSVEAFETMSADIVGLLVAFDKKSCAVVRTAIYFARNHVERWQKATGNPHVSPAVQKEATKYLRALWKQLVMNGQGDKATYLVQAANLCGCFVKEVKTGSEETADGTRVQVDKPVHMWTLEYAKTDHTNHTRQNKPNATKKEKDADGNEITVTAYNPNKYALELLIFKCTYENIMEDEKGRYWQELFKYVKAFKDGNLTVLKSTNSLFINEVEKSDTEKATKALKDAVRAGDNLANKLGKLAEAMGDGACLNETLKALGKLGLSAEALQKFLAQSIKENAPCVAGLKNVLAGIKAAEADKIELEREDFLFKTIGERFSVEFATQWDAFITDCLATNMFNGTPCDKRETFPMLLVDLAGKVAELVTVLNVQTPYATFTRDEVLQRLTSVATELRAKHSLNEFSNLIFALHHEPRAYFLKAEMQRLQAELESL